MLEPDIIFEDDDMLVINKPAGLLVHETGASGEETVVEWLLRRQPEVAGVGEAGRSPKGELLERSGVVHRLDRDTSGVLVLAKTAASYTHLKAQFHDRLVQKTYHAFVYGALSEASGTIDRAIGRSASDFRLRSAQRGARGTLRQAVTDWQRIKTGTYNNETFSYVALQPHTGRTHQLRVHLKAVNHPIICDNLYGGKQIHTSNNLGLERLALHAYQIEIALPSGETRVYTAPVPECFTKAAARLDGES